MPPVWRHMMEDNMKPEQQPAATAVKSVFICLPSRQPYKVSITCSCSDSDSNN